MPLAAWLTRVKLKQAMGGAEGAGVSFQYLAFDLRQMRVDGGVAAKTPPQLRLDNVVHPAFYLLAADTEEPTVPLQDAGVLADNLP